jgi:hypothetical protein
MMWSYPMRNKGNVSGWEAFGPRARIFDTTMIPAENHRDFENRLRDLYEEFFPAGPTEEDLVERLAVLRWERDRVYRYEQMKMEKRQAELNSLVEFANFDRKLRSLVPEFQKARTVKEVEGLLSELEDAGIQIGKQWPLEKCDDPEKWGRIIAEGLTLPPYHEEFHGRDVFFKLVEEFPIIERLERLERIDVMIDRTIKRLLQLKTMKQMHRELEPKVMTISEPKRLPAKK